MRTRGPAHAETKQRILASARTLLARDGFEQLSLRAVAKHAGFSPASLYEYFDSKDELVRALANEAVASLTGAMNRAVEPRARPVDTLVALGLAYVRWALTNSEDFLILFSRLPSQRRSHTEAPAPSSPYLVVRNAVAQAVEAGALEQTARRTVEDMSYALWAAAHGMAMLQLTHLSGYHADFAQADETALRALVAGFAP